MQSFVLEVNEESRWSNIREEYFVWLACVFISDPTHLIKKFRNNLAPSSSSEGFPCPLEVGGQSAVGQHIRDVYHGEGKRCVALTTLTSQHINRTSLSKMKARLALDVFKECVEDKMKNSDEKGTVAVKPHLHHA